MAYYGKPRYCELVHVQCSKCILSSDGRDCQGERIYEDLFGSRLDTALQERWERKWAQEYARETRKRFERLNL